VTPDDPFGSIAAEPPALAAARAEALVLEHYGIVVGARALVSERDQNFLVTAADGSRRILKIANAAEPREVTLFQVGALLHIEEHDRANPGAGPLAVPRIVRCSNGDSCFETRSAQGEHLCRMVSYLPGERMADRPVSAASARSLGAMLARLDRALGDYSHSGEKQALLWDMKQATALRRLLRHVGDESIRAQVSATLDEFEASAAPAFDALPWQVIHNDANPANVLLGNNDEVCGLIDFGDMLRSPRIIEIAVAASYLRVAEGNPLALIVELLAGYHAVAPLQRAEVSILHILIRTRLASTLLILAWRSQLRGPDDDYLAEARESEASAQPFFMRMGEIPTENAGAVYSQVCASADARDRGVGE